MDECNPPRKQMREYEKRYILLPIFVVIPPLPPVAL
jgi:hypothetical protein